MKRIELLIIEDSEINDIIGLLNNDVGSVYFKVTPRTLSNVRKVLVANNFTTRLFVISDNENVMFYVYGKKKKSNAVFNEHCKNSLIRTENYIEQMIDASTNVNDLILTDHYRLSSTILSRRRFVELI